MDHEFTIVKFKVAYAGKIADRFAVCRGFKAWNTTTGQPANVIEVFDAIEDAREYVEFLKKGPEQVQ